ncbi:MAG: hypothetical protein R3B74_03655 [Nitrospirales bacterium]|nr:hypothetical protein [Nitrospirales bacterium]
MFTRSKMVKSLVLAGMPFLTLPLLAESGISRDRGQGGNGGWSSSQERIVSGEIFKKRGDEITLRGSNGERIRFRINNQTNQLCPRGSRTSDSSSTVMESSSHKQQSASDSGQTSSGSLFGSPSGQTSGQQSQQMGFKFGECNFQNGEFVRAKVDENGNATFVRSMGDSQEYYGTAGVGEEYFVLPAGQLGGLDISDKDAHYSVKSTEGQEIGNIYRVMVNDEGDMTYAIVRKKDGQLISVPWQALEGAGNKSFKLKVTQNQLGNLPIIKEGESVGSHVQQHWDLTERERQNLAKWNERTDDFNETRDRYYEDTPTFPGNREGYDRYDQRRSSMNRSGGNRQPTQPRYQDQYFDDSQVRHYGFSPSEYPPPENAPQYEQADQQRSFDRNRREYDRRGQDRSRITRSGEDRQPTQPRYQDQYFDDSQVRHYGFSPSEYPPPESAPQYEGADQQRRSSDDVRNRMGQRSMYSQSRERNYNDTFRDIPNQYDTTTRRSQYDPQRERADQYQSRRSSMRDYDYRPDQYRP